VEEEDKEVGQHLAELLKKDYPPLVAEVVVATAKALQSLVGLAVLGLLLSAIV
jgi:hypothetical protein